MIGVLDYGVGNVGAFIRIFHSQNINAMNIKSPSDFDKVDKIILPGVGSFDSAIDKLNSSGLRDRLDDFVQRQNYPLLAVCIGMHMLGNSSEEGSLEGLGYINGQTKKIKNLDEQKKIYIPHMGWNSIEGDISNSIWLDIDMQEGFYFLHSYHFEPESPDCIIGTSKYPVDFTCGIQSKDIYGFQFHPEKSLSNGIKLLTNFAKKN